VWHPMKIHKRQRFPDLSLVRRHGWTCARGVSFSSTFAATLTPVRHPPAWRQIGNSRTSRPHLSAAHCLGHRPLLLPAPPSLSLLRALFLQHRLCLRCGSGRRASCLSCTPFPRDNGALWGVAGGLGGSTFAADRHYSAPCAKFDAGMRGSAAPLRWNRWLSWYPPLLSRRIVLCHPVAFSFATPSHSPLPPRRILFCYPAAFCFAAAAANEWLVWPLPVAGRLRLPLRAALFLQSSCRCGHALCGWAGQRGTLDGYEAGGEDSGPPLSVLSGP